ncbi:unnamed protein product [Schistosoma rodhaini]|nr:unnamed protein product [Schistosoma rodhaini]
MGGSMSRIVPGLYIGGVASAQSKSQLEENGITHVCSVLHYNFKCPSRKQLLLRADDDSKENIAKYFRDASLFIHEARVYNGAVLVHCACGVSRSVTITLAYLMTITNMPLPKLVRAVVGARPCACPNSGFLEQLIEYGNSGAAAKIRRELIACYGEWPKEKMDADIAVLTELLLKPEHATCIGASGGFTLPDDVTDYNYDNNNNNQQTSLDNSLNQQNSQKNNMKPTSYTIYPNKPLHIRRILAQSEDNNQASSSSSSSM